ncbi:MAG: biotin/lipoyl-binding protein [Rhodobacteraceae bacterium]|nr:biotin/lipoyl-binding protein [Paracoccaceae bacterium]
MSDLSFQVRAPLGLELSTGERLTISDWSLKGFDFPNKSDVLPKEAVLSIPFQGVDIRFPIKLKRDGDTRFLSFDRLSGRQRETLAVFYRSILSGRMASTEDVITSLDTPVDLVPMEETEEEKAVGTAGTAPRSLRAAFSVLLYLCIGAVVFWTLGSGIWGKLATVDIHNARIEAQMLDHTTADRGFVKQVLVAEGDRVERGDILVRLTDPGGEAALTDVRSRIDLIENRLAQAELTERQLALRIDAIRAQIVAALQPTFPQVRALLDAFDARLARDYADLFSAHDVALQQMDMLGDELRRLRRERGRLREAGDALHVTALDDGFVTHVFVLKGQMVGRAALVAIVEADTARQARGWLDQSMAAAIYPGMSVNAEIASATGPERLVGVVDSIEAGIDPDISPEFGMLVRVSFPNLTSEETRARLPHLSPTSLEAERPWARAQADLWATLKAKVGL